jgi:asparagine synthase (glutamine-hydrolysing)
MTLDLQTGSVAKRTYWNPYAGIDASADTRSAQQVMDEYMELLDDAVRIRIQDDDTAWSFLSGGLDSSIICALAARYKPLETFSIITRTTLLENTSEPCTRLARDLHFRNTQLAVPYHRLTFSPELWKKRVWRAESPFNHTDSLTKTLLHDAVRRLYPQAGYALTGTGSDQLNGGLARWIVEDADTPEENWQNLLDRVQEAERRHLLPERLHALWGARRYLSRDFIGRVAGQMPEDNPWMYYIKSNLHINRFVLLWDENRAASAHRHSARYPFYDHRFVEFIARVPQRLQGELFFDKQILRVPAERYLPDYILHKPKAPAIAGMYDHRFQMYQSLLNPQKLDLLEEALGPVSEPHPAIDKKALVKELERLCREPNHIAWQYLFNVINLGLLEKLPFQNEASMQYEDELQPFLETLTVLNAPAFSRLSQGMDILPETELLVRPLHFCDGCSLVSEHRSGRTYINKNETLAYELDEENPAWRQFLFAIDGERSTTAILNEMAAGFDEIRDYFYLCLKEDILRV